jgi:glycosyltransferase involved in cell wall biosynthesis
MRNGSISGGIEPKKIRIIPNGTDLDTFGKAGRVELVGEPALLLVGRLEQEKGIDIFVQSMTYLAQIRSQCVILHAAAQSQKGTLSTIS